ncbi:MAG: hypothetical protein ABI603_08350 [Acidobacteriota bacterium]
MPHPLVLALYTSPAAAAVGARAAHAAGVPHDSISVVSRNHDEDTALAAGMDATPGAELEDSRTAGRLGELSGYVLAAIALVLPGVGPIVAAGPLSAGLGEAAGHAAGGLASALSEAGLPEDRAEALQRAVADGAVLIAVHTTETSAPLIRAAMASSGATLVETANWSG